MLHLGPSSTIDLRGRVLCSCRPLPGSWCVRIVIFHTHFQEHACSKIIYLSIYLNRRPHQIAHAGMCFFPPLFPFENYLTIFKTVYNDLMIAEQVPVASPVWKLKVPLKIKVFMWYLSKGVTLTKDNLLKKNWKRDSRCCFCNSEEAIQQLFFECHACG